MRYRENKEEKAKKWEGSGEKERRQIGEEGRGKAGRREGSREEGRGGSSRGKKQGSLGENLFFTSKPYSSFRRH